MYIYNVFNMFFFPSVWLVLILFDQKYSKKTSSVMHVTPVTRGNETLHPRTRLGERLQCDSALIQV